MWCFVRAAAGSERQTGILALHTHNQPPQRWHRPALPLWPPMLSRTKNSTGWFLVCNSGKKNFVFKSSVFQK